MRHRAESEESHESESHDFAMDTSETRVIITYDVDSYTSTVGQYRTYPLGFTHNGSYTCS